MKLNDMKILDAEGGTIGAIKKVALLPKIAPTPLFSMNETISFPPGVVPI